MFRHARRRTIHLEKGETFEKAKFAACMSALQEFSPQMIKHGAHPTYNSSAEAVSARLNCAGFVSTMEQSSPWSSPASARALRIPTAWHGGNFNRLGGTKSRSVGSA